LRNQNLKNLRTEKDGIKLLRNKNKNFFVPTLEQRKFLYELSGIDYKKYSRSVDGVILKTTSFETIKSINDFLYVEIKTTKSKSVKKLPYGVFFGFTKNEEDLFKKLENYRLCFVHIDLDDYVLITYSEYLDLVQSKRVQYQITLKNNDK
tara:strand:+ start:152 stop:601 length:450 start_codon:yes stop_codon:yes gene_type:complete